MLPPSPHRAVTYAQSMDLSFIIRMTIKKALRVFPFSALYNAKIYPISYCFWNFYSSSTVVAIISSSDAVPSFIRSIPDRRKVHIPSFAA